MLSSALQIVLAFGSVGSFRQRAARHLGPGFSGETGNSQSQSKHKQQKQQQKQKQQHQLWQGGHSSRFQLNLFSHASAGANTRQDFFGKCMWTCVENCGAGNNTAVMFRKTTFTTKLKMTDGATFTDNVTFTALFPILNVTKQANDKTCVRFGPKHTYGRNKGGSGRGKLHHERSKEDGSEDDRELQRFAASAVEDKAFGLVLAGPATAVKTDVETSGVAEADAEGLKAFGLEIDTDDTKVRLTARPSAPMVQLIFEALPSRRFRVKTYDAEHYLQIGNGEVKKVGETYEYEATNGENGDHKLYFKNKNQVAAAVFTYTCGANAGC